MDRRVKAIKRNQNGRITALCNAGESWSPRRTRDVLREINAGQRSYYVQENPRRTYVRAVAGALETTPDAADLNHLERLPTC